MKIEILEAAGLSETQIIAVLKAEQASDRVAEAERIANERERKRQNQIACRNIKRN